MPLITTDYLPIPRRLVDTSVSLRLQLIAGIVAYPEVHLHKAMINAPLPLIQRPVSSFEIEASRSQSSPTSPSNVMLGFPSITPRITLENPVGRCQGRGRRLLKRCSVSLDVGFMP